MNPELDAINALLKQAIADSKRQDPVQAMVSLGAFLKEMLRYNKEHERKIAPPKAIPGLVAALNQTSLIQEHTLLGLDYEPGKEKELLLALIATAQAAVRPPSPGAGEEESLDDLPEPVPPSELQPGGSSQPPQEQGGQGTSLARCTHCGHEQENPLGSLKMECRSCGKYFRTGKQVGGLTPCPKCKSKDVSPVEGSAGVFGHPGTMGDSPAESIGRAMFGPLGAAVGGIFTPQLRSLEKQKRFKCNSCGLEW